MLIQCSFMIHQSLPGVLVAWLTIKCQSPNFTRPVFSSMEKSFHSYIHNPICTLLKVNKCYHFCCSTVDCRFNILWPYSIFHSFKEIQVLKVKSEIYAGLKGTIAGSVSCKYQARLNKIYFVSEMKILAWQKAYAIQHLTALLNPSL